MYTYGPGASVVGSKKGPCGWPLKVHAPLLSGVPPSESISAKGTCDEHVATSRLIPASGAMFSTTVTKAGSFSEGAGPMSLYLDTPGAETPGTYVLVVDAPTGSYQAPPGPGVPVSRLNRSKAAASVHTTVTVPTPASTAVFSITVTKEESAVQPALPGRRYL